MFELISLGVLAIGAYFLLALRKRAALPRPLRGATLHLNERTLSIREPIALAGRPDQVWRSVDGDLVITDTKTRRSARVYPADIVQLSAYAYILRRTEHAPVHRRAFVRVPGWGGGRYLGVDLLPDARIEVLHARYHALLDGEREPDCNGSVRLCHHCGHKPQCPRWT